MEYGNTAVVLMVIAVVVVVLSLAFGGTYCLNKDVDRNARG
jgi:type IV secretory pathway VirB2 component (pilin)